MFDGAYPLGALNYWKSNLHASLSDAALRTMCLIPGVVMNDIPASKTVMAGLGPAIHVFAACIKERRGWPAPGLRRGMLRRP